MPGVVSFVRVERGDGGAYRWARSSLRGLGRGIGEREESARRVVGGGSVDEFLGERKSF